MAVTSEPTPVKLPAITSGGGNRNNPKKTLVPAKTVYTATKVEKVTSTDGKVQYQTTVIQYDNANKDNPKTIATGYTYTDANGKSKTVLEPAAGLDEQTRRAVTTRHGTRARGGRGNQGKTVEVSMNGAIANASQQQVKQSKEIQDLAKNASEQETLDSVSGPQKETETNTNENTNSLESGELTAATEAKVREQYALDLRYPIDLQPSRQDTLKISVYKFVPRKLDGLTIAEREKFSEEPDSKKGRKPIGAVVLPVTGPKDSNKVGWGGKPMSAIDIAMSDLALSGIKGGIEGMVGAAKEIGSDVQSDSGDVKKGLTAFFAQQATGVQGLLSRTEGIIVNPNLELLFNGPSLRSFGLSYKMSPRSEPESIMIKKIIRLFKQSMAAQRSTSNLFLKTPNTYRLQYLTGGTTEHEFLPKIKECALTSFNVNYAADGTYATFGNTSPISYELQFTFQELTPIFNDDYGNLEGTQEDTDIGF